MIDSAPLAHEPSDAEIARRIAVLELPTDDPRRLWEPFTRRLDDPATPTAALLQRWLGGSPVTATDLLTREQNGRQYRVVTLVTAVDGAPVPLCHASSVVELALLPEWARDDLIRTERPLARVLGQAGAVRDRSGATVLDAEPGAPGDAGLRVRGAFRLPGAGGRMAALVEEWFTGFVLHLHATARTRPVRPAQPGDELDDALVRILRQRRVLADARTRLPRRHPHDAAPEPHPLAPLVHLFGRDHPAPTPGRASGGENAGRPRA